MQGKRFQATSLVVHLIVAFIAIARLGHGVRPRIGGAVAAMKVAKWTSRPITVGPGHASLVCEFVGISEFILCAPRKACIAVEKGAPGRTTVRRWNWGDPCRLVQIWAITSDDLRLRDVNREAIAGRQMRSWELKIGGERRHGNCIRYLARQIHRSACPEVRR